MAAAAFQRAKAAWGPLKILLPGLEGLASEVEFLFPLLPHDFFQCWLHHDQGMLLEAVLGPDLQPLCCNGFNYLRSLFQP